MKNSNESLQSKKQPQTLNPIRLGFAVGCVVVLFYLGCMLTMATVSHEQAVTFFNSLLHGLDVEPILRKAVPANEVCLGLVSTFVLGWLGGAAVAGFYNLGRRFS
ncbi:MAG: DUF5676 family membrane protein [Verrucomicrobiales bacterium]|nr:DUF5676 family membrane protein [Verrucomicrobiales bacterium]